MLSILHRSLTFRFPTSCFVLYILFVVIAYYIRFQFDNRVINTATVMNWANRIIITGIFMNMVNRRVVTATVLNWVTR